MQVDGKTVEEYVRRFAWNEARFSPRLNLREIVDKIVGEMTQLEDDLKARLLDYNGVKNAVAAEVRRHQGSLVVKDIHTLLAEAGVPHVDSENLQACYLVVPKFGEAEFLKRYTGIVESTLGTQGDRFSGVVPGSAVPVAAETDYVMYQVVIFKRIAEDFRQKARGLGLQVRDYRAPEEGVLAADPAELQRQLREKQTALRQWLQASFSEAFAAFMHLVMLRVFVESILRYGLPPQYQAAVLEPYDKAEHKARAVLADEFGSGNGELWRTTADDARAGVLSSDEIYPYVSYNLGAV